MTHSRVLSSILSLGLVGIIYRARIWLADRQKHYRSSTAQALASCLETLRSPIYSDDMEDLNRRIYKSWCQRGFQISAFVHVTPYAKIATGPGSQKD
ncbi:hypothetical protein AVEN_189527-1 [Araneus ventricosus]|uniref:Uncharacterized protein n=1 Tax=Araneus ventricosus TaxID=182803 RepID=A0A4Y2GKX0_ARAVE|nr:hypothetical protein AVEN_189527-1 [Araneus ventricosus]